MNNYLNFKIVGSGPTGLLLAISLSKLNFNIYLTDTLTREKLINKDKTYAITHSTRKILSKFNLWDKLSSYLYKFDSLSISDSVISKFTILTTPDLDKDISSLDTIGWVIKHSELMNVFFDEIDKVDNISFKSSLDLSYEKINFDYKFISTGANSNYKKNHNFLSFKKSYNQSCLTFEVLVRGNVQKRAYEIFRKEGPLALLPLDYNRYQIIWTSSTSKSVDRLNSNKSFLLDNLSTILPECFKLDQINSEINLFPVSLSLSLPIFNFNKEVLVGDSFHTFHPVGGQGLNTCWRDVNVIYDMFNKHLSTTNNALNIFKYKYYFKRSLDIFSIIIITDTLIKLFANNNIILLPFRKISFLLLNKSHLIRKFVLNKMTKSLIFSSIK
ncbi:possible 2-octaprenyl-6-methoxyphenol 4-monoxygenase; UbiH [Prochlorococcus marinus str. MIT 9515]|uniref:Possible 2-octaprenyl-6-methoxyphenol 4-monoxygenase UbiH n=1 Tax=Prochlorococcus marinus (strain MIT 9515) TaxID=167542 RepID=A2BWF5_PROM5|nr:FAD-dependent monooxygenase [Prochlorococcus marinus]ABM72116.1 possible 2-octaprenyl-6-methoxyphenol 4-monoxygenase; UbiH [Prochlorococcus marinus str. MIT 9515]